MRIAYERLLAEDGSAIGQNSVSSRPAHLVLHLKRLGHSVLGYVSASAICRRAGNLVAHSKTPTRQRNRGKSSKRLV